MLTTIPKIIHQIWIQGEDNIPDNLILNKNKIEEYHPDWEYVLWDEISLLQLLKNTNKQWLSTYNKFNYLHQKVDYAKFIILYIYGGIYIDMDAYTIKKLDSLFDNCSEYDFIVSYVTEINPVIHFAVCRRTSKCLNNGIFISKPNVDILRYLINNISHECSIFDFKLTCIANTTGPVFINKHIFKYINTNNNKNKSKILILDNDYLEPCLLGKCEITDNTYIKHEHYHSWISSYLIEFIKLYLHNTLIINILVILLFILIIYLIFFYFSNHFSYIQQISKKL